MAPDDDLCAADVGSPGFFPTQNYRPSAHATITVEDSQCGAPYGPIPRSFLRLAGEMSASVGNATDAELALAMVARRPFLIAGYPEPYMHDIVRAFRLLRGRKSYVEIGTFDRGNLAYASTLLADDGVIIGIDTQDEPRRDAMLRGILKSGQRYASVVGDSRDPATVARVRSLLDSLSNGSLDSAFIDGCHTAQAVLSDYANYGSMVSRGGVVMFHDSLWEGDDMYKGVADALAEIDKLDPLYLIPGERPCYRFMRPMWRDETWGVVAVHFPT